LRLDRKEKTLLIDFDMSNAVYLKQNNYLTDNSDLWNKEAFEIFISAGATTPRRYVEIQLNPNGAWLSAWVDNPDGIGTENTLSFFNGHEEHIETSVVHAATSWQGKIKIPLTILGRMEKHYRINFFRIVSLQSHDASSNWACTAKTCHYLSWSPTFSGSVPAFHVPEKFGHLLFE